MSLRTKLTGYLDELRRRRVFQAGAAYAVVTWMLLQIAEVTFEPLHFPDWALTALVVLVIAGFPVTVLVAWFLNLTWQGFKKDPGPQPIVSSNGAGGQADAAAASPSIAVLSFDDMSPLKDQEYLCDGIAEEILNRLTQIQNLRVASRTSSFRFKGHPTDVSSIGRQLKVATVLEGSVRKSDDQLRITTQLVNVNDGYHLWSHSYEHKLERIFEIQDEIASQVAEALEVTLNNGPAEECCTTSNVEAYDAYLKGVHRFHSWGLRNVRLSIECFSRAVELDPGYARAWAALAYSYAMTCMYWNASKENLEGAGHASLRALELLPGLAESHVSRGLFFFVNRQEGEAIAEFETAQRLDPKLFEAYYFYARVRFQRGEMQQAAALFEKAERLRPDDFQAPILLRQVYRSLGREDEAKAAARRGTERAAAHLEIYPDDTRALNLGFAGLIEQGEIDRATKWAELSLRLDGDNPDTLYNIACGFALMGEPDRALDCLERAGLRGMAIAQWAENDSDFQSLKDNSRFRSLMASFGGKGAGDGMDNATGNPSDNAPV